MSYSLSRIYPQDSVAWKAFDRALYNNNSTIWRPHQPNHHSDIETFCIARLKEAQTWWLCRFNKDGHIPTVGPFETWQQALLTLKLIA